MAEIKTFMRAAVVNKFGSSKNLYIKEDFLIPKYGHDDLLVKVFSSSINPVDYKMREGHLSTLLWRSLPSTFGFDVSGQVESVGKNVKKFKPGDLVYGMLGVKRAGSWAEYAIFKEEELSFKPKNIDHSQASTIPLVGLTSYQALVHEGKLKPGNSVLVLGGSGGTGTMGVQMARGLGASKVFATCSNKNKEFLEKELKVDRAIDYTNEDFSQILKDDPVDVVYDCIGNRSDWKKVMSVIKKTGHFVTIQPGGVVGIIYSSTILKSYAISKGIHWSTMITKNSGKDLEKITELIEEGHVKPVVEQILPLEEIKKVNDLIESGRTRGKISIKIVNEKN